MFDEKWQVIYSLLSENCITVYAALSHSHGSLGSWSGDSSGSVNALQNHHGDNFHHVGPELK